MKTKNKPRRYGKDAAQLPKRWSPRTFSEADGRFGVVKELRRRCKELMADTGADSVQKRMLCEEAVFVGAQLETMRTCAAEGKAIDTGAYTQMLNCLQGILGKLGLEKQLKAQMSSLEQHIKRYDTKKRKRGLER